LRLATWAGLRLEAADVVNLRLILMTLLPNIAGLVLAFGVALAQGPDYSRRSGGAGECQQTVESGRFWPPESINSR